MILILTGASGTGKSTSAQHLLEQKSNIRLLSSYTTRQPRDTDLPGEYVYLSQEEFEAMKINDAFLWHVEVHGFCYGTTRASVENALNDDENVHVMILVMDIVETLRSYANALALGNRVCSFYILSPPQNILIERLRGRGEDEATVEKRLKDCLDWDERAKNSKTPFRFVRNESNIQRVVDEIVGQMTFGGSCL